MHKGTEITSNSVEKLADYCVEHKDNKRNDKGGDPRSQNYNSTPLFSLFSNLFVLFLWFLYTPSFLPCCAFFYIQNEPRGVRPTCLGEFYSPR